MPWQGLLNSGRAAQIDGLISDFVIDPQFVEGDGFVHRRAVEIKVLTAQQFEQDRPAHSQLAAATAELTGVLVVDLASVWSDEAKAGSLTGPAK